MEGGRVEGGSASEGNDYLRNCMSDCKEAVNIESSANIDHLISSRVRQLT